MPPAMASETALLLYGEPVSALPLFKLLSQEIINAICKRVVPLLCSRDQAIIREGEMGTELFFLLRGEVEVTKSGVRLGFLGEGAFFGESAVLSDTAGTGTEIRQRTVSAVVRVQLESPPPFFCHRQVQRSCLSKSLLQSSFFISSTVHVLGVVLLMFS